MHLHDRGHRFANESMSRFRFKRDAVILLALAVLAIVTTSWLLGSELVRPAMHPVPLPIGFTAQQVTIPSQGHAIAGWWIDNHADTPVVLLLPGIRADRSSMASRATLLRARGFSVLLIDLQTHGETPGEQITLGWRESLDVEAALGWLKSRFPGRRIGGHWMFAWRRLNTAWAPAGRFRRDRPGGGISSYWSRC